MRASVVAILAFSLLLLGCSHAPSPESSTPPTSLDAPASPTPRIDCGVPIEGAAPLLEPASILLIGEMHGTDQVPQLVGRLACFAAERNDAGAVVGLEIPAENQAAVDAYLASDGSDEAFAALLAAPHFVAEWKDGRNSQAMAELLATIRRWRARGVVIDVLCFDAATGSSEGGARDAAMASTIAARREARPSSTLIVLSGNIHNRTKPGTPWDADYVPMGATLRERYSSLVSLDFRSAGGGLWVCMGSPDGETRCGEARTQGEDRGPDPLVERFDAVDDKGFDGVLYVGTTTASPPAVPGQ